MSFSPEIIPHAPWKTLPVRQHIACQSGKFYCWNIQVPLTDYQHGIVNDSDLVGGQKG